MTNHLPIFDFQKVNQRKILAALITFHIAIICMSNYLVQLPVTFFSIDTTWGSFTFPFIFVTTDLTVRLLGKQKARIVIAKVMLPALLLSYLVSVIWQQGSYRGFSALLEWNTFVGRIALASFSAYVLGQLLDIQVFNRLRQLPQWWIAPTASAFFGMFLDTITFFAIAFAHGSDPYLSAHWFSLALVDYSTKLLIGCALFVPLYGALLKWLISHYAVQIKMLNIRQPGV